MPRDHFPRTARSRLRTSLRLQHASPKTGAQVLGTDSSRAARGRTGNPVRLTHASPKTGALGSVMAGPHAARVWTHETRDSRHPRRRRPVTLAPGPPSPSLPRSDPDPGVTTTCVAQDRSPGTQGGQPPRRPRKEHRESGQTVSESTEFEPPGHGTTSTLTAGGQNAVPRDHFPRTARSQLRTSLRLAHESPKTAAQVLGTDSSGAVCPESRESVLWRHGGCQCSEAGG